MTIKHALQYGNAKLSHLPTAELDTVVLLSFILQKEKTHILAYQEERLNNEQQEKFKKAITKRSQFIPVAYITGFKEFFDYTFVVNKDTLIPRPETELIIEYILEYVKKYSKKNLNNLSIFDIGTGSGAIGITLAKKIPDAQVTLTDISQKALKTAKKNAQNLNASNTQFVQSNLLENIPKKTSPNIIVANLPYLSKEVYKSTEPDIKHEPLSALVANDDGMELYKILFNQIKERNLGVDLYIEINPEQYNKLKLTANKTFENIKIKKIRSLNKKHIIGMHFNIKNM